MIGTLIVIVAIIAVIYYLSINGKLNSNFLNDSSGQSTQSSNNSGAGGDSIHFDEEGTANVKFSPTKIKNLRISYGDNYIQKISVTESPMNYSNIIEHGNKIAPNSIFLGIVDSSLSGFSTNSKNTTNFILKRFKNMFIIFKGSEFTELAINSVMARYECNEMVYCLLDSNNVSLPDFLKDVNYPIVVYANNSSAQLALREWGYSVLNESGTLFIKNEKSFRIN